MFKGFKALAAATTAYVLNWGVLLLLSDKARHNQAGVKNG